MKKVSLFIQILTGIFLCISLFSYSSSDPGLFVTTIDEIPKNLCGQVGAFVADFLFGLFGVIAFFIPIVLFKAAYKTYQEGKIKTKFIVLSLCIISIVSALVNIHAKEISIFGTVFSGGGLIGSLFASLMINLFNTVGTYVVLASILTIVLLEMNFSFLTYKNLLSFLFDKNKRKVKEVKVRHENEIPLEAKSEVEEKVSIEEIPVKKKVENKIRKPEISVKKKAGEYVLPGVEILKEVKNNTRRTSKEELIAKAMELKSILQSYKIEGDVIEVVPGPVVTMYEFAPAPGIKVNQIVNLSDDLAMKLKAESVRIIPYLPGKGAIGIEVPNEIREMVPFKEVISSDQKFMSKGLPIVFGKNTQGEPITADLVSMPHLLVAGTTGSGKSVAINSMITSILFTKTPEEVKMIMIDPKTIEFASYEGIPHLLLPVVTDPTKANFALKWAVNEMETRYRLMAYVNARNIDKFNEKIEMMDADKKEELDKNWYLEKNPPPENGNYKYPEIFKSMPYIVVIIDELADLMLVAPKDVETSIVRIAQKARASGIHLVVATQRPSANVITGLIKANLSSRIAFKVAAKQESRIIIDANGAESLLGAGDMLYMSSGGNKIRIHGAYISDGEVESVAKHWVEQGSPEYIDETAMNFIETGGAKDVEENEKVDELFDRAVEIVASHGEASISMLQRKLNIGYNRAAKMIEMMEDKKMVGPSDGIRRREVYISPH